jgi:putative transposase
VSTSRTSIPRRDLLTGLTLGSQLVRPPQLADHRHTGIGLHTPADVHFGLATDKAANRRTVLTDARARHPHCFGTVGAPKILDLPDTAWINRPAQNTTQETATTAA